MALASLSANAQLLPPGGDTLGLPPGANAYVYGAPIAVLSYDDVPVMNANGDTVLTFDLDTAVFVNPVTGFIDIAYQVTNDSTGVLSPDNIARLTGTNFAGWTTLVSQRDGTGLGGPFVVGSYHARAADRTAGDGSTVGFQFRTSGVANPGVAPGVTSYVLFVETNATTYRPGSVNIIDGGVRTVIGFAPAPEASSIAMLLPGLLPLGFVLRRKMARKA
jgi:hypothetical protein